VMHFGLHNNTFTYTLHGEQLGTTELEKDLGVLINNKLSSSVQSQAAAAKANKVMGCVKWVIRTRDGEIILPLYKTSPRIWGAILGPAHEKGHQKFGGGAKEGY
ncbi:hypothetical protein, partial [Aestuariirhabdus sp. LZHN29]|uniref:hypothetical protein n=1 Tax=Aestuariirhabdus sp. LZHN29 TaxID=3417462 RepID=UPI003CF34BC0